MTAIFFQHISHKIYYIKKYTIIHTHTGTIYYKNGQFYVTLHATFLLYTVYRARKIIVLHEIEEKYLIIRYV